MIKTPFESLIKIDTVVRQCAQKRVQEALQNCETGSICIQGCPGAGKSSLVKEMALNNPCIQILYLTLNGALVESSKLSFAKYRNINCTTLDSLTYAAAFYDLVTPEHPKMHICTEVSSINSRMDKWAKNPYKAINITSRKLFEKIYRDILKGSEQDQIDFLTWPVLRKIVHFSQTLSSIVDGSLFEATNVKESLLTDGIKLSMKQISTAKLIVIDESQDLESFFAQMILKHIVPNKFVVWLGDHGQAIYSDGEFNIFNSIKQRYLANFILRRSYRVPEPVSNTLRYMGSGYYAGNPDLSLKMWSSDKHEPFQILQGNTELQTAYLFHTNASIFNKCKIFDQPYIIANFNTKRDNYLKMISKYEQELSEGCQPRYPNELTKVFGKDASKMVIIQVLASIEEKTAHVNVQNRHYVFHTVHSFKGAECQNLRIADDIWNANSFSPPLKKRNIVNVALTRATENIFLDGSVGLEMASIYIFRQLPPEVKSIIVDFCVALM